MKSKFFLLIFMFCSKSFFAQLNYFSPEAMNGYTLFLGDELFLVNNCGEVIKEWNPVVPNFHVKLLPNGNIVYIDWISNSVIERSWEDNLLSQVAPLDDDLILEYEVIVLENGNYLCVARKDFSTTAFLDIGYHIDSIGSPPHVDVVVELDAETGETLWLWNITDHVIQERSDTLPNYGSVINHPELLNMDAISINHGWMNEESFMINGMDYNSDLDQIVLSVRKMSEIIVIDHSTTTVEAASHSGGNSEKGGDILYRWGNPQNYNRGTPADQALFYQHNPNWIHYGEHIGKIAIYNNGLGRPGVTFQNRYSNAPIIETPILSDGNYDIDNVLPFLPSTPSADYGGLPNSNLHFYSNYTSANKVLPNGNVLISIGDDNRVIEVKPDGTLVWEYQLATAGFTFRAEKYPLDFPAFDGKDLTPMATIETPPSNVSCNLVSSNENILLENNFKAWINTTSRELFIQVGKEGDYNITIFDFSGKVRQSAHWEKQEDENFQVQLPTDLNGVLLLTLVHRETGQRMFTKLFL